MMNRNGKIVGPLAIKSNEAFAVQRPKRDAFANNVEYSRHGVGHLRISSRVSARRSARGAWHKHRPYWH